MQILKAQRTRAKARVGISGPSGSGKTYSALLFAYGLVGDWEKICVIDSEVGSSNNYAHLGEFNVLELSAPFSPDRYIEAIKAAESAGMEAIVIDSVSHEWDGKGGCLEINDHLAQTKYKGNTWAAWSETTPRHQKFIEAIVGSKAHIIATSRSKTETTLVDGKPKKVGTKDIQRDGFEYEMTLMFNIDRDSHFAMAVKDRTSLFIDRDPFKLSIQTGEEFRKWLETGIDPRKAELEREQAEQKARDDLYDSYITKLDSVKDSETLKSVYEDLKNDAKTLGADYTKDLTDRIKSIKEEIAKGRQEPNQPKEESKQPKEAVIELFEKMKKKLQKAESLELVDTIHKDFQKWLSPEVPQEKIDEFNALAQKRRDELEPIERIPEQKEPEKPTKKDEKHHFVVTKEATKKFMETTRAIRVAPDHDTLMELMDEFFANLADKVTPEMVARVEAVAEERLQGLVDAMPAVTAEMEDGSLIEVTVHESAAEETTPEAVQSEEPTELEPETPQKSEKTYTEIVRSNGDIVRKWSDGTIEIQKK